MKKILSTFVMCVILGVGSVWAVDATLNVTIKTVVRTSPTDPNGEVVANVCTQEIVDGETVVDCADTKSGYWNLTASMEVPPSHTTVLTLPDNTNDHKNKAITLSGSANLSSECSGGNYVFSHWEASSGVTIKNPSLGAVGICSFSVEKKQGELFNITSKNNGFLSGTRSYTVTPKTGVTQTITFTAVWVQPQVTSVTVNNCGEVTDPTTPSADGQFAFVLNNDLRANNYTYITNDLEAKHFSVKSNKYTKGSYVFAIGYQPTGVHGTYSATMTLTSNYPVSTDPAEKSKTATIQVVENYLPKFTMVNSYDFGVVSKGSYKQTTAGDFSLVKNNYAANNATWTAWIEDNAHGLYQIQDELGADGKYHPISGEPSVRFTPNPELPDDAYTATLYLKAIYTDANENEVVSETKEILLNAVSYTPGASSILFAHNELDFGTVYLSAELPQKNTYLVRELVKENSIQLSGFSESVFDCSYADGNVYVGIKSDVACGDYNTTVTVTADKSDGNGSVTDDIILNAKIRLTTPELTALGGVGVVTLSWKPVYGADYYIIQRDGSEIYRTTDNSTTSYLDKTVTNGNTYSYKVIAVYTANTTYNTFSETTATEGLPTIITPTNATSTGLSTGTTHPTNNTFPYKLKEDVVLTRCFGISGNALFDVLYIFGLTTDTGGGDDVNLPSVSVGCNAKTPCYVYHKSVDGTHYVYNTTFDAVTKRFDHKNMGNKKLYFTGYCPFANIGRTVDDEGWMYFEGNQSSPVDIYLEDCQIYGRFRSSDGSQDTGKYPYNEVLIAADVWNVMQGKENINHMKGFSSIFVFHSTATSSGAPYKPTIHIRGNNHLKGQLGYINEVFAYVLGQQISMEQIVGAPLRSIGTSSAPITIKSSSTNGYTHLTMDDFWPTSSTTTEPTNGYLKLDTYTLGEASRVPSIDMGSEFSSLTFNGGQYNLHNSAAPDGEYTCNMAISHRKFYKSAEVLGQDVKVSLYGFGGDKTTNQVIINSGTFTMEKNMYGNLGGSYYIDQDQFLDLRLPAGNNKSQINGGAFNGISNVVFCSEVASSGGSPVNATGDWLCLQDVTVNDPPQKTSYGSNEFTIPSNWSSYYTGIAYDVQGNDEVTVTNDVYGGQSVNVYTKEGNSIVTLLLPGEEYCGAGGCAECEKLEESLYRNWATTIPLINLTIAGIDANIGGDEEVPYKKDVGESTLDYKVNQLMYMDLEGYQNRTIEIGDSKFTIANSDKTRGNFTNEKPYTILKHLNLLKVVQADHWYTFVAPFNIHKVEVLELDEDKIEKLSGKEEAMQAQIQATAKFLMDNNGLFLPNTEGRSSGLTLEEIVMLSPEIQKKELIPLYHYNGQKVADNNYGKNILEANYYLYEAPEGEFDKTETKNGLDTFHIVWEPVHREGEAGQPLMKQGRVYAIQFPYCPMCAEVTTNDYWSNKMIRFYGAGYGKEGQTINGTDYQNTILAAAPSEGNAMFKGNSTLADMTLDAADKAYVHNMANDYFVLNTSDDYPLKPTEGFMLYNPGQASMPARISRSGQIEYDENAETGVDGVPTVGDRTSLMLFGAYDGFEVLALHEQLVTVYNLQGNIIFQQYMTAGEQVYVATGAGIYVVRGEKETIKVMVD